MDRAWVENFFSKALRKPYLKKFCLSALLVISCLHSTSVFAQVKLPLQDADRVLQYIYGQTATPPPVRLNVDGDFLDVKKTIPIFTIADAVLIAQSTLRPIVLFTQPAIIQRLKETYIVIGSPFEAKGVVLSQKTITSVTVNTKPVSLTAGFFSTPIDLTPGGNTITADASDGEKNATATVKINLLKITGLSPKEGKVGDIIKISGQGFPTNPSKIKPDFFPRGKEGKVKSAKPDFIEVEVPAGSGTIEPGKDGIIIMVVNADESMLVYPDELPFTPKAAFKLQNEALHPLQDTYDIITPPNNDPKDKGIAIDIKNFTASPIKGNASTLGPPDKLPMSLEKNQTTPDPIFLQTGYIWSVRTVSKDIEVGPYKFEDEKDEPQNRNFMRELIYTGAPTQYFTNIKIHTEAAGIVPIDFTFASASTLLLHTSDPPKAVIHFPESGLEITDAVVRVQGGATPFKVLADLWVGLEKRGDKWFKTTLVAPPATPKEVQLQRTQDIGGYFIRLETRVKDMTKTTINLQDASSFVKDLPLELDENKIVASILTKNPEKVQNETSIIVKRIQIILTFIIEDPEPEPDLDVTRKAGSGLDRSSLKVKLNDTPVAISELIIEDLEQSANPNYRLRITFKPKESSLKDGKNTVTVEVMDNLKNSLSKSHEFEFKKVVAN